MLLFFWWLWIVEGTPSLDTVSSAKRSEMMAKIRSTGSQPEWLVRRVVHGMGYRYRLHRNDLPGRPDMVFPTRKKIIFVHGCFWHQHSGCRQNRIPLTNVEYWATKLKKNKERDQINRNKLHSLGWKNLVIWECEAADTEELCHRLRSFLGT